MAEKNTNFILLFILFPLLILPTVVVAEGNIEIISYSTSCGIVKVDSVETLQTLQVPDEVDYLVIRKPGAYTDIMEVKDRQYVFPKMEMIPTLALRRLKEGMVNNPILKIGQKKCEYCRIEINYEDLLFTKFNKKRENPI